MVARKSHVAFLEKLPWAWESSLSESTLWMEERLDLCSKEVRSPGNAYRSDPAEQDRYIRRGTVILRAGPGPESNFHITWPCIVAKQVQTALPFSPQNT